MPEGPLDPMATVLVANVEGAVQPVPVPPVSQATDGTLRLAVADAEIVGTDAKLDGEKEQNVGYWTNASDYVEWRANVAKPGDFDVLVNCACEPQSAGSEYKVVVGDKSLSGTVRATANWNDYHVVKLGTIHLDQPGTITVTVKPVKKPGPAVMNLRSITLKPTNTCRVPRPESEHSFLFCQYRHCISISQVALTCRGFLSKMFFAMSRVTCLEPPTRL